MKECFHCWEDLDENEIKVYCGCKENGEKRVRHVKCAKQLILGKNGIQCPTCRSRLYLQNPENFELMDTLNWKDFLCEDCLKRDGNIYRKTSGFPCHRCERSILTSHDGENDQVIIRFDMVEPRKKFTLVPLLSMILIFLTMGALLVSTCDSFIWNESRKNHSLAKLCGLILMDNIVNNSETYSPDTCVPQHGFSVCFPKSDISFKELIEQQTRTDKCFSVTYQRHLRSKYVITGLFFSWLRDPNIQEHPRPKHKPIEKVRETIRRRIETSNNYYRSSGMRKALHNTIDELCDSYNGLFEDMAFLVHKVDSILDNIRVLISKINKNN